jgi:hypothetical protein
MAKPYLDLTVTFVILCWRNINKLILLAGIVFRTNVAYFGTNFKIQLPPKLHKVTCTIQVLIQNSKLKIQNEYPLSSHCFDCVLLTSFLQ